MSKTLLSFILPVYNVEAYLEECVASILPQCSDECQIVLVDDGATDSSGKMCDALAATSPLITVVHQENGGLSAARNAGLNVATGEYVAFVDSDDRIAPGSVAKILDWIREGGADYCFMEAIKFYPDGSQEPLGDGIARDGVRGKSKLDAIKYLASRPRFAGAAWSKIYRKRFLDENNLRFPNDRRISEDLGFTRDCMLRAETMDALAFPYYEYRQIRVGSITNSGGMRGFNGLSMFVEESAKLLTRNREPVDEIATAALSFAAYELAILVWSHQFLPSDDKKKARAFLREYLWVLNYSADKKAKILGRLAKIVGLGNAAFLLEAVKGIKRKEKKLAKKSEARQKERTQR